MLLDAGYPATGISHALAGQDVQVLVRLRSDRVFYAGPAERAPGQRGAPRRHGQRFALDDPGTHHPPGVELAGDSPRYGKVRVRAWKGLHQALARTGRRAGYPEDEQLPAVKGTVICVTAEHLPGGRKPLRDLRLWHHGPAEAETRAWRTCCGRHISAGSTRSISTGSSRCTWAWTPCTCPAPRPPAGGPRW